MSSDKYSLIAEGIYEKGFTYGSLKFGAKHIQSFTKQEVQQNGVFKSDLNQMETSVFSEWNHSKDKFSCSLGLKANRVHFLISQLIRVIITSCLKPCWDID